MQDSESGSRLIEAELAEIEGRMGQYSPEVQADIRWLARELRKAHNLGTRRADPPAAAIYDELTGLLSGAAYGVRFAVARARAGRNGRAFAAMSIELAAVQAGEAELEAMLKLAAGRLAGIARATDTLARVDRLGFAMILEELNVPADAERVKQKVEAALAEPVAAKDGAVLPAATVDLDFYPATRPGGTAH